VKREERRDRGKEKREKIEEKTNSIVTMTFIERNKIISF
jgi:hypothetical protein